MVNGHKSNGLVVSTIKYEFVNGQDYPIYYGKNKWSMVWMEYIYIYIYIYVDICWVIQWYNLTISMNINLVGGWPTPLKNDGVRQWEGWHSFFIMENNPNVWNHQPVTVNGHDVICLMQTKCLRGFFAWLDWNKYKKHGHALIWACIHVHF